MKNKNKNIHIIQFPSSIKSKFTIQNIHTYGTSTLNKPFEKDTEALF